MPRLPILTYHGVNVAGNDYATNDHVALASDLDTVDRLGWRIVPLPAAIARWLAGDPAWAGGERTLAITFDDGTDFDWRDLPHPAHGTQRSLFVGLADRGWWSDAWWRDAVASGHAAVASHSWDHNHDLAEHLMGRPRATGTFRTIDRFDLAEDEIARASAHLKRVAPNPGDRLFAYPYGETNDYLVRDYFPSEHERIGVDAAFADGARPMTGDADRWA